MPPRRTPKRAWSSGFCSHRMPSDSHRRCPGSVGDLTCSCVEIVDGRPCHGPAPAAELERVEQQAEAGVRADLSADAYHAHPALSSTGARKLLPPSCPAIFRYDREHPPKPKLAFDFGHAAHTLALGAGPDIKALPFDDRRTNAYKAARDEAYAAGKVPLLQAEYDTVQAMVAALRAHPTVVKLLDPEYGTPEQSLFWTDADTDVACRARLDWLPKPRPSGRLVAWDYKSAVSAEPSRFAKAIDEFGYHAQGDWYLAGMRALDLADDDAAFLFVVQEKTPPYLVTIAQLDHMSMKIARARNHRAREIYRQCLEADHWPAYADAPVVISLPIYAENRDLQEYAL